MNVGDPAEGVNQLGKAFTISQLHKKWWEAKIIVIDESDLIMFKDMRKFDEYNEYWIKNETIVVCVTATPQQTDDPTEKAILEKWWGFKRVSFQSSAFTDREIFVNCDEKAYTEEEQKTFVLDAVKKNPVLLCKNKGRFENWAKDASQQFKLASALTAKDMRTLEKGKHGENFVAYFMDEDYVRGCDYHTSHRLANGNPGEVHVISLDSWDNKADMT